MIQCSSPPSSDSSSSLIWILIGCGIGIVLIAIIAYACYRKNRSSKKFKEADDTEIRLV